MLFEKLLSSRQASRTALAESPSTTTANSRPATPALAYRNLVRMVLRDLLRQHGIPLDWVGCEVTARAADNTPPVFQVNFVVHTWHEGLLRYTPQLQQKMLQGLQYFQPNQDHRQHVMAWVISPQANFPLDNIPGPTYWRVTVSAGSHRSLGAPARHTLYSEDQIPTAPGALN